VRAEGTATTLHRWVVLSSAPRDARWPIATHHPVVSYSPLFFPCSVTHFPSSLLSAARLCPGAINATPAVVAVHGLDVGARPSSASQLVPSALVCTAADLPSDALGQPRRPVPTTVGSSNKCCTPAIPRVGTVLSLARLRNLCLCEYIRTHVIIYAAGRWPATHNEYGGAVQWQWVTFILAYAPHRCSYRSM